MTVAAILHMKGRRVETIEPQTSVQSAAERLAKLGIGALVVIDADSLPIGILSERDVVAAVAKGGEANLSAPVERFMSSPVITCQESDTIDSVMGQMTVRRFRHVPVVHERHLAGIISIGDVVKHKIAQAEMEAAAMRAYITTG